MPTPQPSTDTDVIVIGAGPAGAAAARVLTAAGVHTVLLDREHAAGGRTRTDRKHGFAIDSGAIFVMGTYRRTRSAIAGAGREHHMRRWVARTELREARGRYPVRFDAPHTFLRVPQLRWTDRVRLVAGIAMLMLRRGPEPFDLRSLADDDNGETMEAWSRRTHRDRGPRSRRTRYRRDLPPRIRFVDRGSGSLPADAGPAGPATARCPDRRGLPDAVRDRGSLYCR